MPLLFLVVTHKPPRHTRFRLSTATRIHASCWSEPGVGCSLQEQWPKPTAPSAPFAPSWLRIAPAWFVEPLFNPRTGHPAYPLSVSTQLMIRGRVRGGQFSVLHLWELVYTEWPHNIFSLAPQLASFGGECFIVRISGILALPSRNASWRRFR